jgi:hypothetical protein
MPDPWTRQFPYNQQTMCKQAYQMKEALKNIPQAE